jgi:hypothetical protein
MIDQWKPGAGPGPWPAMVLVEDVDNRFARVGDDPPWIRVSHLRPMPPTITPEQQAVLDAARRWHETGMQGELMEAVRAMLASQQPPDPAAELLAAAKEILADEDAWMRRDRLRAAIVAVEKAQKS